MSFLIFQKGSTVAAVELMAKNTEKETRNLKERGFKTVCEDLDAHSRSEAIKRWEEKGLQTAYSDSNTSPTAESLEKGYRILTSETPKTYQSNYSSAQLVVTILSIVGWFTVFIGVVLSLISMASATSLYAPSFLAVITLMSPGFITAISGIFSVAAAQFLEATVDNADHTYLILKHLESNKT